MSGAKEFIPTQWRDHGAGLLRAENVGERVTVGGWVARRRDHGGLIFIDLRDHTGIVQLVVNPENAPEAAGAAHDLRNEFVVQAQGEVVRRAEGNVNPNLPTGEIEVQVDALTVLSRSLPLPFQLDEEGVDEMLRIKYRWIDLRRERMQRNLREGGKIVSSIRRRMEELGFVDFATPSLTRTAPEGARDFVVPVRLQPGRFFALAQSPQIYKQLYVIGGFDRYYQIATCWRDEDLRADRQFEFRQLDVEMAFADRDAVLNVLEEAVTAAFEAVGRQAPARPFQRLTWHEVMDRYGSDKPDLRFALEIHDGTDVTRDSQFGVFANAPAVRFIVAPRAFSRAELDRLEQVAKDFGAKGLAYVVHDESGEVRSPIAKFLSDRELEAFRGEQGTTTLFAAGEPAEVSRVLGGLRTHLGRELGLAEGRPDALLWVLDFPWFEWDEDNKRWTFIHHPFTGVLPEHVDLIERDPRTVLSQAYDLVWNGWELGSGSLRIHDEEIQARVFRALGMDEEEQESKFGFLLEALRMGAPPHGGFAMGIDRFIALLVGETNIREVTGFPKVSSGADPLTGAPSPVAPEVLGELGLQLKPGLHPADS
jgi:aspartyl-tRNA synthetase